MELTTKHKVGIFFGVLLLIVIFIFAIKRYENDSSPSLSQKQIAELEQELDRFMKNDKERKAELKQFSARIDRENSLLALSNLLDDEINENTEPDKAFIIAVKVLSVCGMTKVTADTDAYFEKFLRLSQSEREFVKTALAVQLKAILKDLEILNERIKTVKVLLRNGRKAHKKYSDSLQMRNEEIELTQAKLLEISQLIDKVSPF